jgi:hypothetical protein
MKIKNILKNFILSLYISVKRFPISISLATLASILLIILSHNEQNFSSITKDTLGRIAMVLFLGIPLSLIIKFVFERKTTIRGIIKVFVYSIEILILLLYYLFLLKNFEMVSITRYIAISLSLYLWFIIIPYFFRRNGFELYVIKLITRFFVTVLYSVVLFLGIAAILFTIDKLLGITVTYKIYLDLWILIAGIFAPCFFLAGVPQYEDQMEMSSYPKLLSVMLLYIVMPIISAYTTILYIYFAKIIIVLQWPEGMVAHLVLWYSIICAITIFLITPLKEKNSWSRTFISLLPKLILPLIIMLFVSIGIRVNAYGLTENRYFVIILGLWAFGIMIYFNIGRTKRNIVLAISLSAIAFLSVFGPWSSYSLSKLSQNNRLERILSKYDMVKDNMIVKSTKNVSEIDKREISNILSYFSRNHELTDVKYLPQGFKIDQMKNIFGFANIEYDNKYSGKGNFSYSSDISNAPINIKGYDHMLLIRGYKLSTIKVSESLVVQYDNNNHQIKITNGSKELYNKSILSFVNQLYDKYGANNMYDMTTDKISFEDQNNNIKLKIIFQNVYGRKDNNLTGGMTVDNIEFYLLLNLK